MIAFLDGRPVFADTGEQPCVSDRPTLVFIHGAQNDHFVWKAMTRWFAGRGYAVLAIDLPGHGRSAGPPLPDVEAMAGWLLELVTKVGAGGTADVTLIGHSMGSLIALEAAARAPGMIDRLVMIGTAVPMPVAPALLEAARLNEIQAMALINRWSHSPRAISAGGHGLWLPVLNQRIMERQPPGVLHNDLAACNAYAGGADAAARLACPVTLIAGTADRMTSLKAAQRFATLLCENPAIPAVELVQFDGVGHAFMAEAPEAVRQALQRALA